MGTVDVMVKQLYHYGSILTQVHMKRTLGKARTNELNKIHNLNETIILLCMHMSLI